MGRTSQLPKTPVKTIPYPNFLAGLSNTLRPYLIPRNALVESKNFITHKGGLLKRLGTTILGTAYGAFDVTTMFRFYANDASNTRQLLRIVDTVIQRWTGAAWANVTTGLTAGTFWSAAQWKGNAYMLDGTNTEQKYVIATNTIGAYATPPGVDGDKPTDILLHMSRLWAFGGTVHPSYLYYCEFGDDTVWKATSVLQVPDDQSNRALVGGAATSRRLIVFTHDTASILVGVDVTDFDLFTVKGAPGCGAKRSIQVHGSDVIYASKSQEGIFSFNGSTWDELSKNIREEMKDIDWTSPNRIFGIIHKNLYRFYYKRLSDGTNRWLLYDFETDSWSGPHTGSYLSAAVGGGKGDANELWLGSIGDGKVYEGDKANTYQDDGVNYECLAKTKIDDGDNPVIEKNYVEAEVHYIPTAGTPNNLAVKAYLDRTAAITVKTVSMVDPGEREGDRDPESVARSTGYTPCAFLVGKSGRAIQMELSGTSAYNIEILGLWIHTDEYDPLTALPGS